jgi:thiol-disulfide isomerase/thioredoxin
MRFRSLAAVVSTIALTTLASSTLAQDTPPSAVPAAAAPAQAAPAFGSEFSAADRSEEAVKLAKEALAGFSKAYKAAPTISEKLEIAVSMPGAPGQTEALEMTYGEKGSFRMGSPAFELLAVEGMAYLVPGDPKDKYVEKKVEGSLSKTLGAMLPGFSMPSVALAMRDSVEGEELVGMLGGPFMTSPEVKGMRMAGSDTEILLEGDGGAMVLVFDGATKLQKATRGQLSPPGAPEGFAIGVTMKIDNTVADKLEKPIVFEKGERTAVASVMDLGGGGGEDEQMKVAVGDSAPVGKLVTLDGKEIDTASLKGKVVIVDFWATWCGPCKRGLPLLQEFASSMKDNDKVVVYPVNVWERAEDDAKRVELVKTFWNDAKYTMPTLLDMSNEYVGAYGVSGIPTMVIIGPDGTIADIHVGFDEKLVENLTAKVKKLLEAK